MVLPCVLIVGPEVVMMGAMITHAPLSSEDIGRCCRSFCSAVSSSSCSCNAADACGTGGIAASGVGTEALHAVNKLAAANAIDTKRRDIEHLARKRRTKVAATLRWSVMR